jgi:heme oxygenase
MSQVMERVRSETADLHKRAETSEFQQRMVGGRLSRDDYVAWLGQMYCIHVALEAPLRLRAADSRFAAVTEEQYQEPYLVADLATFDVDPATIEPLPATRALCDRIARDAESDPLRLLGFHYVLEGSNNGNRFIVRGLRPALGLTPGHGDRYLDPYGESQGERWRKFKEDMTAVGFSEPEIETLVAAARDLFSAIGDLSLELAEATVPSGAPAASPRPTS